MKKIKKGSIVIDKITNKQHIVECIDYYDDVVLVFTEDKKYININNVDVKSFDNQERMIIDSLFGSTIEERDKNTLEWLRNLK